MASPGGWLSAYADFFKPQSNVRLFTVGKNGVEELSVESLSSQGNISNPGSPCAGSRIYVFETRGSRADLQGTAGIQISESLFKTICSTWHISPRFLEQMSRPGALPRFEYLLEREEPTVKISKLIAINIGFRWGSGHGEFIIALGKYSLASRTFSMFCSSRGILEYDGLNSELLRLYSVSDLMERYEVEIQRHPLTLICLLMECCERFIDIKSQKYNLNMLQIGDSLQALYPSAFAEWIRSWNINSAAKSTQNTLLFDCYNDVTWIGKNCFELMDICRQYLWLSEYLEKSYHQTIPQSIVRGLIHRTEIHSRILEYLEKMINTQFSHQYNYLVQKDAEVSIQISRATKKDGESMKTLAYLTLFFLPITFVCAIFSTTVFNFQNWHISNSRVVSPGWWVFVLSCVAAMIATLCGWFLLVVRQHD
ncbi:uncharacterized protein Z518_09627 [Rhinocladiella mackenziei CBS 650.93]|uniref:Uncharacterized protein n=1 Tax=Rhinocladiella mackenziei CBS 650.93 TaxID=1442369 RepID=A0A0D2FEY1_9EURO|nr:uncharacterized protein Z518_09627 [Rhinocladiella mackenziei CBS 650.93]KIX00562.1 hypothetical protein Z518_09627 [Rhinocladiella mackenziei CBS 650.93]